MSKRHNVQDQESLEIKKDDKFFTRIMSKETSMANSSCRVYYGGASSSVPFDWESRPGTPKHTLFSDSSNIPPLTPPPSYYSKSKSMHKTIKPNNFTTIFRRRLKITPQNNNNNKTTRVSPSSSMSSSSTTSSSSCYSSPSPLKNSKFQNRPCFLLCSPIHYKFDIEEDDNDNDNNYNKHSIGSPTSTLMCYGGKSKALNVFGGCYLMDNMKNAFLSMVRHGSS